MKCEGFKRNGNGLELCNTEIEGIGIYRHGNHVLCAECTLNLRFNCKERRWMFYIERLSYLNTYVEEYDYEDKLRLIKMRMMR